MMPLKSFLGYLAAGAFFWGLVFWAIGMGR